MKKKFILFSILATAFTILTSQVIFAQSKFVHVDGVNLVTPEGKKLFIKGTNLGNWLNPEGYMFSFQKTSSPHLIDAKIKEMVGPQGASRFWKKFKDNYITRKDVEYIASTGANTIRLPFNYKLFTYEDYMGENNPNAGFEKIDSVVNWCRDNNLYLILDMHDAPGGQTGDNIDDSYAYPWIFEEEEDQNLYCDIWKSIAERYKDEPVILGYELFNEPIPHFFENKEELNAKLEPLYRKGVDAIREIDKNHIILIGGAQWNGNFSPITDLSYDPQLMLTCHRYGGDASSDAIRHFIDTRDKFQRPMYMGEIGHNTMEWQKTFSDVMTKENIGYTFWPYKKLEDSCMMGINKPENWSTIVDYVEGGFHTYGDIREHRPDFEVTKAILDEYLENCLFENCIPQKDYIESMNLMVPEK